MRDKRYFPTPTAFHILLALSTGEMHGYRIMQKVKEDTSGQFSIGPGILYTTIKRLLEEGLIEESDQRPDPALDDQRRRYYRLTNFGRQVLSAEAERLAALALQARTRLSETPAGE